MELKAYDKGGIIIQLVPPYQLHITLALSASGGLVAHIIAWIVMPEEPD